MEEIQCNNLYYIFILFLFIYKKIIDKIQNENGTNNTGCKFSGHIASDKKRNNPISTVKIIYAANDYFVMANGYFPRICCLPSHALQDVTVPHDYIQL